ncbi:Gldg family protein [Candidatus Haliotispira prima]|uniref:Gldg family protein n=1 Tax=Candidatus Haliotispira prima TaxID=3034016 RepID=A0ABY8MII3_9SPIO|nr:Gldg family protein [Candidatus Haliotispira prima]
MNSTATSDQSSNELGRADKLGSSGPLGLLGKLQLSKKSYQGTRFCLYILVIVLLNAVASFLSVRADLTEQKIYSLAPVSKATVAQLEEPVTIRVYLSGNLPSHYNILSSLLRDLLQTYRKNAKRGMFSYSINMIRSDDESEKTRKLQEEARKYGIEPIQLQGSDGNEIKAVLAYLGLVISQGENLEVISPLSPDNNIQYTITAALQKMSRKGSALLSMKENVKVYYYFSPLVGELDGGKYAGFPANFERVMKAAGEQLYGRVESRVADPAKLPPGLPNPGELRDLPDTEITGPDGKVEKVYSAIVIENEGRYSSFSLLRMEPTLELGPEGLQQRNTVNVIDPSRLEGQLSEIVVGSLGIAQNVGYIADRETAGFNPPNPQVPAQGANLYQFSQAARDLYKFQPVNLDEGIGKDINVLMLVDPKRQLSDWDLYRIDQFVMRGGRLVVAMEPYQIMQSPYGYGAQFIPNPNIGGIESNGEKKENHTLIDVLRHYGIEYQDAMVFDKNSFIQRGADQRTGGYQETPVYYIPEINAKLASDLPFIRNLKKLYSYNSAPLKAVTGEEGTNEEAGEKQHSPVLVLLRSSPESWTEKMDEGSKDLNNILPPEADKLSRQNLIMATDGPLESFFRNKDIPEPPKKEQNQSEDADNAGFPEGDLSLAGIQDAFIERAERGRVLVSGTSLIFDAQLLSVPTNKALALNLLDYLAGNQDMADLRARSGVPNFIGNEIGKGGKDLIKWFNILGLPFLAGLFGLLMLLNWRRRQLQLRAVFSAP